MLGAFDNKLHFSIYFLEFSLWYYDEKNMEPNYFFCGFVNISILFFLQ